jgi:hypothetical protein
MGILCTLFGPRLMRWSTPVNDSLSGASSFYSAAGSSANVESSSGSFNVPASPTILCFGWPIAASIPTSRDISFGLLFIERLANGPCMLARLRLQTRQATDALIVWPLRELDTLGYDSLSRVHASPRTYFSRIRSFLFGVRVTVL